MGAISRVGVGVSRILSNMTEPDARLDSQAYKLQVAAVAWWGRPTRGRLETHRYSSLVNFWRTPH